MRLDSAAGIAFIALTYLIGLRSGFLLAMGMRPRPWMRRLLARFARTPRTPSPGSTDRHSGEIGP